MCKINSPQSVDPYIKQVGVLRACHMQMQKKKAAKTKTYFSMENNTFHRVDLIVSHIKMIKCKLFNTNHCIGIQIVCYTNLVQKELEEAATNQQLVCMQN